MCANITHMYLYTLSWFMVFNVNDSGCDNELLGCGQQLPVFHDLSTSVDMILCVSTLADDCIWSIHARGLLLPKLLQHPGPDCGGGLSALHGDGVSSQLV